MTFSKGGPGVTRVSSQELRITRGRNCGMDFFLGVRRRLLKGAPGRVIGVPRDRRGPLETQEAPLSALMGQITFIGVRISYSMRFLLGPMR